MRTLIAFSLSLCSLALLTGCSGEFWGGAGSGVVGTGAAYEVNGQKQMHDLDEARKAGKVSQEEYDIRKDQIQRDYLLK